MHGSNFSSFGMPAHRTVILTPYVPEVKSFNIGKNTDYRKVFTDLSQLISAKAGQNQTMFASWYSISVHREPPSNAITCKQVCFPYERIFVTEIEQRNTARN